MSTRNRRRRRSSSRIPEVNLIPMIDVLMVVLVFFVLMSMAPTTGQVNGVTLPNSGGGGGNAITGKAVKEKPFVIGLDTDKTLILDGEPASLEVLGPAIEAYFEATPEGSIMLKADRTLRYEDISAVLSELRNLIGDRSVSLAVE
jgi:biopolymer transport protein ExbD